MFVVQTLCQSARTEQTNKHKHGKRIRRQFTSGNLCEIRQMYTFTVFYASDNFCPLFLSHFCFLSFSTNFFTIFMLFEIRWCHTIIRNDKMCSVMDFNYYIKIHDHISNAAFYIEQFTHTNEWIFLNMKNFLHYVVQMISVNIDKNSWKIMFMQEKSWSP